MQIRFRFAVVVAVVAATASAQTAAAQFTERRQQEVDGAIDRALTFLESEQLPGGAWRTDSSGESTAATSLAVNRCSEGMAREEVGDCCRDELGLLHLHGMVDSRHRHLLGVRD